MGSHPRLPILACHTLSPVQGAAIGDGQDGSVAVVLGTPWHVGSDMGDLFDPSLLACLSGTKIVKASERLLRDVARGIVRSEYNSSTPRIWCSEASCHSSG